MNGHHHHPASSAATMNGNNSSSSNSNNKNVGILAMQVYTPRTYIRQDALEAHMGVPAGKYTIGLGQASMGVVSGDAEDINSICLTVLQSLLEQ